MGRDMAGMLGAPAVPCGKMYKEHDPNTEKMYQSNCLKIEKMYKNSTFLFEKVSKA